MPDIERAMNELASRSAECTVEFGDESRELRDVAVRETPNPVRGPTARGNVYVEDARSYRISGSVDASLAAALSGTMLGPSSTFGGLRVVARHGSGTTRVSGSLLSMARTGDTARLSIAVVAVLD